MSRTRLISWNKIKLEIQLLQNLVKVDLVIYGRFVTKNLVFQIRGKNNTQCASYIVNEITADRTDKLENGCQFGVDSKLKGQMSSYQIENRAGDRMETLYLYV